MKPQLFVPAVSAAGLLVIGHCISTLAQQPLNLQWLALAALTLLTGSFTIKIPSVSARLSVSETFVFASVLLFGTCAGTITVALEILIILGAGAKTHDPLRILFNVSAAALSIWSSSILFFFVANIEPLGQSQAPLETLILPLALLATSYFLLNSGMVAAAVAIERRTAPFAIWRSNFLPLAVNYLGGASVAALFVSYTRTIDLVAFGVIVPLLIISYLTFKYSFSRIEDATQHVAEMKRLYLSTIETLATAIDAKDQVTHGHIRRVQQLALGLAREIGVKDHMQLQALEAAALLHDTGKLAIPEHILNKPGKLTRGEFEKMKEHAKLGADILSSIDFPYPVVPIVRHHHENWDGNGYPDGLRGTEIPIGARILAVVDCFDALTSDRPYRPRMSDDDAMAILLQRRGVMYDPLVVDTFAANWLKLSNEASIEIAPVQPTASRRTLATPLPSPGPRKASTPDLVKPLDKLAESAIEKTGADVAVIFAADRETDRLVSLVARTTAGVAHEAFSIPLGYGVSGWVAVNATALVNADAALDFQQNPPYPGLVRSICVPVCVRGQAVGVFSVYTSDPRGFSEDDKAVILQLATDCDGDEVFSAFDTLQGSRKAPVESSTTVH
jgi:putative nucleotidyltransferase with HDIG domain